ncbi:hypothetical protein [Halarcobacter bivalviorum]|uniref:DUF2018 domain-containing protein n=1 Tax=Halarcobacter bivalviorum TaxID=663364 RepID=A0AAX2AB40_9BACT|nr:hypothetical protein [Halarcobacter bivalviorum]AXH12008.1 hypothetical protein ABIV_1003 [Halarcobacter bivalviorum]RXK11124.1 hypothetical protein CRV05_01785 [Halarcobacter bivalviorum]
MFNRYEDFSKKELILRVRTLEGSLSDLSEMYLDLYEECYNETMEDFIHKITVEYQIATTDFKGNIVDGKLSIERQILELDDD